MSFFKWHSAKNLIQCWKTFLKHQKVCVKYGYLKNLLTEKDNVNSVTNIFSQFSFDRLHLKWKLNSCLSANFYFYFWQKKCFLDNIIIPFRSHICKGGKLDQFFDCIETLHEILVHLVQGIKRKFKKKVFYFINLL